MGSQSGSLLRRAVVVLLAGGVGILGLVLGTRLRDRVNPPLSQEAALTTPPSLAVGAEFPDVPVVAEDGRTVTTHDLLRDQGGVVMFVEIGCPPCTTMMSHWKRWAADGSLNGVPVMAVSAGSIGALRDYKSAASLTFPVFADEGGRFERDHQATSYPMRLTVGKSLTIRAFTYDANELAEPDRLKSLVAQ